VLSSARSLFGVILSMRHGQWTGWLALALALAVSLASAAVEKVCNHRCGVVWCVVAPSAAASFVVGLFPARMNVNLTLRWLHLFLLASLFSLQWEVKNGSVGRATIRTSSQSWSGLQKTMASCMARLHSAQSMSWSVLLRNAFWSAQRIAAKQCSLR
jgi:hypothetical protein